MEFGLKPTTLKARMGDQLLILACACIDCAHMHSPCPNHTCTHHVHAHTTSMHSPRPCTHHVHALTTSQPDALTTSQPEVSLPPKHHQSHQSLGLFTPFVFEMMIVKSKETKPTKIMYFGAVGDLGIWAVKSRVHAMTDWAVFLTGTF